MYEELTHIARVVKPHGKRGEVVVVPKGALPPLMHSGLEVWIVPPELNSERKREVLEVSTLPQGQLVRFSGVENRNDAEALIGKAVLVRTQDLPDDFELMDTTSLIGYAVADAELGPLGEVCEVLSGVAQDILVVDGPDSRSMIPVVSEFVRNIEAAEQRILVSIPAGLVEPKAGEAADKNENEGETHD